MDDRVASEIFGINQVETSVRATKRSAGHKRPYVAPTVELLASFMEATAGTTVRPGDTSAGSVSGG